MLSRRACFRLTWLMRPEYAPSPLVFGAKGVVFLYATVSAVSAVAARACVDIGYALALDHQIQTAVRIPRSHFRRSEISWAHTACCMG